MVSAGTSHEDFFSDASFATDPTSAQLWTQQIEGNPEASTINITTAEQVLLSDPNRFEPSDKIQ